MVSYLSFETMAVAQALLTQPILSEHNAILAVPILCNELSIPSSKYFTMGNTNSRETEILVQIEIFQACQVGCSFNIVSACSRRSRRSIVSTFEDALRLFNCSNRSVTSLTRSSMWRSWALRLFSEVPSSSTTFFFDCVTFASWLILVASNSPRRASISHVHVLQPRR